jgi:hypothetical protein
MSFQIPQPHYVKYIKWAWRVRKASSPSGFELRIVQPVAIRYATRDHNVKTFYKFDNGLANGPKLVNYRVRQKYLTIW